MKLPWLSGDDDVLAHVRKHATVSEDAPFKGVWATVDFQPDLFSPQRFAIGIVVAPIDGVPVFRLISDTTKLECVYGRKLAAQFDEFMKAAEYSLARLVVAKAPLSGLAFDTDNLHLSDLWPTSGVSQEDVLSRLFREVVPLEPREERTERDFVSLDTEQVRRFVGAELKRIGGLVYERIVVDSKQTMIMDKATGIPHYLDFNLRSQKGVGSVVSAVYKTPHIAELNLLRADRDLRTYANIRQLTDLAVFIMTPPQDEMMRAEFGRLSEMIDEASWRMERGGLRVAAFDAPEPIAESILEWAGEVPSKG